MSLSFSLKNSMLLPKLFTICYKHMQIFSLYKLLLEFMFCICKMKRTLLSWQDATMADQHLSASDWINWFVSMPFFKSNFITESKNGSITLFRELNMSVIVIRVILLTAERRESPSLISVLNKFCSWLPNWSIRLWWWTVTRRITLQASNCTNQSPLWMPLLLARHFLNSYYGLSSGSRSSVGM